MPIVMSDWQQFSIDSNLINHRNDVKMFKTQVEPWAAGEWFNCKVLNILNIYLLEHFHWSISSKIAQHLGEKQIAPSSGHFYCQLLLSNLALDQSVHENSLSLWLNVIYFHFTLYTACFWFCEFSVSYTAWWSPCNIPVSACLLWYIYFCTCYWNRSLGNQWKTFLHRVSLLLCFYWTSCLIYIVVQG